MGLITSEGLYSMDVIWSYILKIRLAPILSNESPLAHTQWIKTFKKEKVTVELFAVQSVLSAFLQNYFYNGGLRVKGFLGCRGNYFLFYCEWPLGKIGSRLEWRRCIHIPKKPQHLYK